MQGNLDGKYNNTTQDNDFGDWYRKKIMHKKKNINKKKLRIMWWKLMGSLKKYLQNSLKRQVNGT